MFPHAAGLHSIGSHNNHTIITPFVTIPGLLTRIGTNSTMVATATAVPNDRTVSTLPEYAASIALRTYSACTLPASVCKREHQSLCSLLRMLALTVAPCCSASENGSAG